MAATSLGLVLLQRAPKCAVDELCSAHAMAFRGFVEPPRQGLIKRHVAVRLGAHRRHQRTGQEVGHRGIGEHGFGRSRRWMGLPLQMKRQRLAGIAQRFIEVVSGRETARNIRDDYPERAPRFFVHKRDIPHGDTFKSCKTLREARLPQDSPNRPHWKVLLGVRDRDFASFMRMPKLVMRAADLMERPPILLQRLDHLSARFGHDKDTLSKDETQDRASHSREWNWASRCIRPQSSHNSQRSKNDLHVMGLAWLRPYLSTAENAR